MASPGKIEGIDQETFDMLKAEDVFKLFDKDSNGTICVRELKSVLRALGQNPTDDTIDEVMKQSDKDNDGVLKWDEYVGLLKDNLKTKDDVEKELRGAFKYFDKNDDGTLNFEELKFALEHYGERWTPGEAEALCKMIDVNKDGKVDMEEFVKYMCMTY